MLAGRLPRTLASFALLTMFAHRAPQTNGARRNPAHGGTFHKFLTVCVLGIILHAIDVKCQDLVPVKPPPSNEKSGVDIDRYVGHPLKAPPGRTHEAIIKRAILTHGSPLLRLDHKWS